MKRKQKQFPPGTYRAIFQGMTSPKAGKHRYRFTVLNDEDEEYEHFASDKAFPDTLQWANEFVKEWNTTTAGLKNRTFLVKLGTTPWGQGTILCWEESKFVLPIWFREAQDRWQRDPNAKAAYLAKREATDLKFRAANAIRRKTWESLILLLDYPDLLGCDHASLRRHIERQFHSGMNWGNYAKVWEVDHVAALSRFDLSKPEEVKLAANFLNLRPCLVEENRAKYNEPLEVAA
jgi:hypothetical protein